MPHLPTRESKGLAFEIVGLSLLLAAAIWQGALSNLTDEFPTRSQSYIQETANIAILRGIDMTAAANRESDPAERQRYLSEASSVTREAMFKLIEIRTSTKAVVKSQGTPVKATRFYLFIFGALLVVIGKCLVLSHKIAPPSQMQSVGNAA